MPTVLPWTSVEIGDLEVFVPSPPCLVVYTSYSDDGPESSVTFFWQDENTGMLNNHLLYMGPVPLETALAWAQEHAPTRGIERIHVKHARRTKAPVRKTTTKKISQKKLSQSKTSAAKTRAAGKKRASKGRPAKGAGAK
jgi:hypothetical protein